MKRKNKTEEKTIDKEKPPILRIRASHQQIHKFKELGRGGEAVVYKIREDIAAKVFLLPNATEFIKNTELQKAAHVRIIEMQNKLFDFPQDLPEGIVKPSGVLINEKEQVFGYVMPFIKGLSLDNLSKTSTILPPAITSLLLLSLYDLVNSLHARGVVIGDLNENNIIVANGNPHIIDADSTQFGHYKCRSFTPHFTAPEVLKVINQEISPGGRNGRKICKTILPSYSMTAPHSELTDWYSFMVIAMRLMTLTDPYGGTIKKMNFAERLENRVTVFDQRVIYPCIAKPLKDVPRSILDVFFRVFHLGERFIPERGIFNDLLSIVKYQSKPKKKGIKNAKTEKR